MTHPDFYVMFGGAYPRVPYAKLRKSNYIDLPNEHYDPIDGQRVFEKMLDGLKLIERLGYDGGVFSEQHNGPIGLLGNPMILGGILAAHTSRIKIGVAGPIVNGYLTPVRLAEEIATLDIHSHGRLIFGLPVGHGMQYHSIGMVNTATARRRYREAHDLLMKCLTEPGPFEWFGEFFQIPYVNLWPRPLQQPHPPVLILGGGSADTLDMVAKHRHAYQAVGISSRDAVLGAIERLRERADSYGYELDRSQVWSGITFHVAETDAQAMKEAEPYYHWVMQNFFDSPMHDSFPPGYLSQNALRSMLGGGGYRSKPPSEVPFKDAVEKGNFVVGSPETVTQRIQELIDLYGAGRVLLNPYHDIKPEWLGNKTLTIFAEEVLPKLRHGAGANHAQHPSQSYTVADYAAKRDPNRPNPTARINGELVEIDT